MEQVICPIKFTAYKANEPICTGVKCALWKVCKGGISIEDEPEEQELCPTCGGSGGAQLGEFESDSCSDCAGTGRINPPASEVGKQKDPICPKAGRCKNLCGCTTYKPIFQPSSVEAGKQENPYLDPTDKCPNTDCEKYNNTEPDKCYRCGYAAQQSNAERIQELPCGTCTLHTYVRACEACGVGYDKGFEKGYAAGQANPVIDREKLERIAQIIYDTFYKPASNFEGWEDIFKPASLKVADLIKSALEKETK